MRENNGFTLSSQKWNLFIQNHWEKSPALIQKPFPSVLFPPSDSMAALKAAIGKYISGDRSFAASFFIDNRIVTDMSPYAPLPDLESLEQYSQRITEKLDGKRFGLILENLQASASGLWFRLREFLYGFYSDSGLPLMDAKASIFLGTYLKTPVGLHQGNSGNFMFVLHGMKRIRLWPPDYFRGNHKIEDSLAYEDYCDGSILLEGHPGDILYWPSGYWHIGESAGELSAGISLALFRSGRESRELSALTSKILETRIVRAPGIAPPLKGSDAAIRAAAITVQSTVNELVQSVKDPHFAQALAVSWLDYLTAFGFLRIPQPKPWSSLRPDDLISGWKSFPILTIPLAIGRHACSAAGTSFSIPADQNVLGLIHELNSGKKQTVARFLENSSSSSSGSGSNFQVLRLLLEKFLTLHAIKVYEL